MAALFKSQRSASQVGGYFVTHYYKILQQHPGLVHQFYNEASSMIRVDADGRETFVEGKQEIDALVTSLKITKIEIQTANFLDSWSNGVLAMVSGVMQIGYDQRSKFVQTFFLAPQEKGYFVLNDYFHFVDEGQLYQPTGVPLDNYEGNLSALNTVPEEASDYLHEEGIQYQEGGVAAGSEENGAATDFTYSEAQQHYSEQEQYYAEPQHQYSEDQQYYSEPQQHYSEPQQHYSEPQEHYSEPQQHYSEPQQHYSEPQQHYSETQQYYAESQQVVESDNWGEEPLAEEPVASFSNGPATVAQESIPHAAEPIKKSYASIVRAAKGPSGYPIAQPARASKPAKAATELQQAQQQNVQQSIAALSVEPEKPSTQAWGDAQEEVESKSVYVGNVPPSVTEVDLEAEFKLFGKLIPSGVAIRSRKESGGYYAFVEFEEISGVLNALKASPIEINGCPIYVEQRRPNSGTSRGGRRGGRGGRVGYQSDAPRGRVGGRSSGGGYASNEYNNGNRTRGNGYNQRVPYNQERGILGSHGSRNE